MGIEKSEAIAKDVSRTINLIGLASPEHIVRRLGGHIQDLPWALYYKELTASEYASLRAKLRVLSRCVENDDRMINV